MTGVWPSVGPISGGTVLSINGRFLNVGSHIEASLDELQCVVNKTQSSSHRLVCLTSRGTPSGDFEELTLPRKIRTLVVTVDGARRTLTRPFTYTPDPTILEMKPLRSPWSGGRILTVHGNHLDSIQAPKVTVLLRERVLNTSLCRVVTGAQMDCPSPTLQPEFVRKLIQSYEEDARRRRRRRRRDGNANSVRRASGDRQKRTSILGEEGEGEEEEENNEVILDLGFIMDGVLEVRHLRKHFPTVRSRLIYVDDPAFRPFPQGVKLYKGDTLVIEGERINAAADESDVKVTIGRFPCNVTSLAATQLVCTPPEDQPPPTDERSLATPERLPLVVVHVGSHLRFPLGVLRYEKHQKFPLSPEGIAGLAAGALFVVLGAFLVLALYRRKTSQAERVYKLMQLQMDSLESHVRTECKQGWYPISFFPFFLDKTIHDWLNLDYVIKWDYWFSRRRFLAAVLRPARVSRYYFLKAVYLYIFYLLLNSSFRILAVKYADASHFFPSNSFCGAANRHDGPHSGPRIFRDSNLGPEDLRHESVFSRRHRPSYPE